MQRWCLNLSQHDDDQDDDDDDHGDDYVDDVNKNKNINKWSSSEFEEKINQLLINKNLP